MRGRIVLFLGFLAAAPAACVATETTVPPRGVVVRGPPPAPIAETQPAAPSTAAVWVAGYWHWTGMQYTWIPGHWENAPPGTAWAAPKYTSEGGAYYYESGGWKPVEPSAPQSAPQGSASANAFH